MTRHEVLSSVGKTVHGLIAQLTPDPETVCFKAFEQLGSLCRISKSISALEVPAYFSKGIQDVILELDAFRTGFARTAEQEGSGSLAVAKSSRDLTVAAFVEHASKVITKAMQDAQENRLGAALASLHGLYGDIAKAESFEDTNTSTIAVTNDPMAIVETVASGSMTVALPGGASNYVINPGDVNAAPPVGTPNPATGSVAAIPAAAPVGESNFVAKAAEDATIAKALSALSEHIEKASLSNRIEARGWAQDLNSPEFRTGRGPAVDFEVGLPKRG